MQFTCNRDAITEAIADTMATITETMAADTCGAADQSEDNVTEPTLITKPDELTLEEYRRVRALYRKLHPPKPKTPTEEERRKRREYQRRYRQRHPDKVRAMANRWRKANPDKVKQHQRTFWMKKAAELRHQSELDKELQCINTRHNCDECPRFEVCEAEHEAMLAAVNMTENPKTEV
jgi:hypothetical protein